MPALPNAQHEKFVQELLKGKSHADAYLAAGYKSKSAAVASAAATRLLKDPAIQARIAEFHQQASVETALTLEEHMKELKASA
jgi:phage terminase small subunit